MQIFPEVYGERKALHFSLVASPMWRQSLFNFLIGYQGALVNFDKFHRVVRDLKLTLQYSCGGLLLKTQVYTSFLWGLNYKPFGSGSFGAQKRNVLNVFLGTEDYTSECFRKYGPKIAKHARVKLHHGLLDESVLGRQLPWDTEEDRKLVYNMVPELAPSFAHAMSESKLGRWFSWNECCEESLPEFWVAKMLLEHHLPGCPDPDESVTQFDDLAGAATKKTPQEELAALRRAGGGLRPPHHTQAKRRVGSSGNCPKNFNLPGFARIIT